MPVALGALVLIGVTGCGGSSTSGVGASPTTSTSGGATSASSTPADRGGGSGGTLKTMSEPGVQLEVPASWSVSKEALGTAASAPASAGSDPHATPGVVDLQAKADPLGSQDQMLKSLLAGDAARGTNVKHLPDLHVNGATLYHVQYEVPDKHDLEDAFGTSVNGTDYRVGWSFSTLFITRAKADELINQVMPTFKLTS